jgi:hypothetical protein
MKILRFLTLVIVGSQMLCVGLGAATETLTPPTLGVPISPAELIALINKNNTAGSSNLLVLTKGVNDVVPCAENGDMDLTVVNGSTGADKAGFSLNHLRAQFNKIQLKQDFDLLKKLHTKGCFSKPQYYDAYGQILLYIVIKSPTKGNYYRLYLNNPWPSTYKPGSANEVLNILIKWGLAQSLGGKRPPR